MTTLKQAALCLAFMLCIGFAFHRWWPKDPVRAQNRLYGDRSTSSGTPEYIDVVPPSVAAQLADEKRQSEEMLKRLMAPESLPLVAGSDTVTRTSEFIPAKQNVTHYTMPIGDTLISRGNPKWVDDPVISISKADAEEVVKALTDSEAMHGFLLRAVNLLGETPDSEVARKDVQESLRRCRVLLSKWQQRVAELKEKP